LASLEVVQDMIPNREDTVLKAATGLEGGLVARGSTCGVVTGGSLGIALMHLEQVRQEGLPGQKEVMRRVGAYVDWFRARFGTTLCRERTGVDFYQMKGQLRYFLPGERIGRCLWHIDQAMQYVYMKEKVDPEPFPEDQDSADEDAIHCATAVLQGIRETCGVGYHLLEDIAYVLDGGVGLKGGMCGAMAGAIMAVNLAFGWDIRSMLPPITIKKFVEGHLNLLRRHPNGMPETFAIGKDVVLACMEQTAGSIECSEITGKSFTGWDDFQDYMHRSQLCRTIIDTAIAAGAQALDRWAA